MRKKDVWTALFCAAALGIGLYCLWGWNRSIETGFTVLTAPQALDERSEAMEEAGKYVAEGPLYPVIESERRS